MSDRLKGRERNANPLEGVRRHLGRALGVVGLFSLFANLLLLAAPLYMLQVYDRVLSSRSEETLIYLTLAALVAFVAYAALDFVRGRVMVVAANWLDGQLRGPLLRAGLDEASRGGANAGGLLRDITTLRTTLSGAAVQPLLDAPWTPIFLLAMFMLHPLMGWAAVFGAAALLLTALGNDMATRRGLAEAGRRSAESDRMAEEAMRNCDAVEAMGMTADISRRMAGGNAAALALLDRASRWGGAASSFSRLLRYGLQIAVLGLGAWLVLQNELTPGAIIAASILMARALAPVDMAISSWRSIVAGRRAYGRIKAVLGAPRFQRSEMRLSRPQGVLRAERIGYTPEGAHDPVLTAVSFGLEAGESLGIVGPTAAGKSTLARVLVGGLKPQTGWARLDGAEMTAMCTADRALYVGYMPQRVELFAGSVRDNIARFTEADDRSVIEAARMAGAHQTILSLVEGYDTEIGPGGAQLSDGQRQQIALARALFGNSAFVVLDEPNANLDRCGEDALAAALAALKARGITSIVISHRPNVMREVDKMLVLDRGRVAMFGPRDDVIAAISQPLEQKALAQ